MAGGYDIGSIFGTLELDDKRFQDAVRGSAALTKLLKLDIDSLGSTMATLRQNLTQAGYNFDNVAKSINTLHFSGMKGAEGVKVVTDALREFQQRAREIQQIDFGKLTQYQIGAGWNARDREYQRGLPQNRFDYAVGPTASGVGAISASTKLAQEEAMWGQYEASNQKHLSQVNRDNRAALAQDLAVHKSELNQKNQATADAFRFQKAQADHFYNQNLQAARAAVKAEREILQEQHKQYFEYRRQMAIASSLRDVGIMAGVVGAIPLAGIGYATSQQKQLDAALTKSLSIMGDVAKYQREDMSQAARRMAVEMGQSAGEVGKAYYYLKSAGMDVAESIGQLPTVVKFSVAANTDLSKSTELLTSAMSALGMESNDLIRISDALVKADMIAKGTALEFAEALAGKGGGALRIVNKGLEEGVAILATYAKVGITGKNAQEALNQVLRDFANTTIKDKIVTLNGETFKFGQIVYDATGKMRPFWDILGDLEKRMEGMSDLQARQFFKWLGFQDRSVKSTTAIMGLSGAMREYHTELQKAAGATQEVSEKQLASFENQLKIVKSRINDMALAIGEPAVAAFRQLLEIVDPVVQKVEQLIRGFERMPDVAKQLGVAGAATAGGAGVAAGAIALPLSSAITSVAGLKFVMGDKEFAEVVTGLSSATSWITRFGSALVGMKTFADEGAVAAMGLKTAIAGIGITAATATVEGMVLSDFLGDLAAKSDILKNKLGDLKPELVDIWAEILGGGKLPSADVLDYAEKALQYQAKSSMEGAKAQAGHRYSMIQGLMQSPMPGDWARAAGMQRELNDLMGQVTGYNQFLTGRGIGNKPATTAFTIDLDKYGMGKPKPGVDLGQGGDNSDLFSALGITDYATKIKKMKDALRSLSGMDFDKLGGDFFPDMDKKYGAISGGMLFQGITNIRKVMDEYENTLRTVTTAQNLFSDANIKSNDAVARVYEKTKQAKDQQEDYRKEWIQSSINADKSAEVQDALNTLIEKGTLVGSKYTSDVIARASALAAMNAALEQGTLLTKSLTDTQKENKAQGALQLGLLHNVMGVPDANASVEDKYRYYTGDAAGAMLKGAGLTPLTDLKLRAQQLEQLYKDVTAKVGTSAYDARVVWVAMVKAQAEYTRDNTVLMSEEYRKVERSVSSVAQNAEAVWKRHTQAIRRQISTVLTDFSANAFDILWPRQGAQADKLAPLIQQLRSAFESITKMGYSNPAGALGEVIGSIIKAGSTAEANAIAIRHFGNEGVLLAKNLRDGSISAEDLASALQKATASIQSYAEQTEKKTNKVKELWREMVRGIVRSLVEDLGNALNEHIRLAERLEGILGKVFGKGGNKAAGGMGIPNPNDWGWGDAPVTPPTVPGGRGGGIPSGGGGGFGSSASGWMSYANLATGAIGAASAVVGNFQMAGMNKSLDLIEHESRYSQIHLYNILNLMNNFLPNLQWINEAIYTQVMPAMAMLNDSILSRMSGTAGTLQVTIGEIVLPNVTDGESLIRDLKALRAV